MKGKWLCNNYSYVGGFETSLKERKSQQYTDTPCLEGTSSGSNIISECVIFIIELSSLILTSIYEHIAQCKNYIYSKNLNAPVCSLPVFLLPLLEEKSMFKFWSSCYFLISILLYSKHKNTYQLCMWLLSWDLLCRELLTLCIVTCCLLLSQNDVVDIPGF